MNHLAFYDFRLPGCSMNFTRLALAATMLTSKKHHDNISKLIYKSDLDKLKGKEKTKLLEQILRGGWTQAKDVVDKSHAYSCFGRLCVRLVLFLVQKEKHSRDEPYASSEDIVEKFSQELKGTLEHASGSARMTVAPSARNLLEASATELAFLQNAHIKLNSKHFGRYLHKDHGEKIFELTEVTESSASFLQQHLLPFLLDQDSRQRGEGEQEHCAFGLQRPEDPSPTKLRSHSLKPESSMVKEPALKKQKAFQGLKVDKDMASPPPPWRTERPLKRPRAAPMAQMTEEEKLNMETLRYYLEKDSSNDSASTGELVAEASVPSQDVLCLCMELNQFDVVSCQVFVCVDISLAVAFVLTAEEPSGKKPPSAPSNKNVKQAFVPEKAAAMMAPSAMNSIDHKAALDAHKFWTFHFLEQWRT
ncbi:unnamed protein product [Durusdinium trenchii]|uniref:Uncharacterized protein n=1 Tax=Durusdinium trenchii TaxID=1381693 RepID=A0ABP0T0F9_9DINO